MTITRKELQAEVLEALRSGKFKQGKQKLHQREEGEVEDSFCCLGVMCVLGEKYGFVEASQANYGIAKSERVVYQYAQTGQSVDNDHLTRHTVHTSISGVPDRLRDFLGLYSNGGNVEVGSSCQPLSLIKLNDGGLDFETIADLLESGMFWDKNEPVEA